MQQGFCCLFGVLYYIQENVDAALHTQCAGAEANIVILCLTPGAAGIMLIVNFTALILFVQTGLGTLFRLTVKANDSVSTELFVSVDKGVENIRTR